MSSKQDRVAARTAADIERKYNFGKTFAEFSGVAEKASNAAEEATDAANEAQKVIAGLDQNKVFDLLTNNGKAQGMFMDENGEIYINASYLAAGILRSLNGTIQLNLEGDVLEFYIPSTEVFHQQKKFIISNQGFEGFGEEYSSSPNDETGDMKRTLHISPGCPTQEGGIAQGGLKSRIISNDADLYIDAYNSSVSVVRLNTYKPGHPTLTIGQLAPYIILGAPSTLSMEIMGKQAVWVEDESGYFTLRGI